MQQIAPDAAIPELGVVQQSMKFVLVPMGSAGDVHPVMWMARLLAARGHDVVIVCQAIVEEVAKRSGVRHVAVGSREEQEKILRHPDLWHPQKAFGLIARHMPVYAREMIPAIHREAQTGEAVMLGGTLAFSARIVAERWNLPLLSLHLQPSIMMSVEETPVMAAGAEWLPRAPRWVKRVFFSAAQWWVDYHLRGGIAQVRREAGVPGKMPRGIMHDWWHAPDGAICLFPEWYARKAGDWPPQAVTTRFPLYDEGDVMEQDPDLEAFLAAGAPPVVVTPGSANAQAGGFLREAAEACASLGQRALLVTRYPEQCPADLPAFIRVFKYVPFGRIFPRAAAVVHHGGVGTTAQCLAAGVPQLIMPMAYDQPDNAVRIKALGAGDYLYPKKFKAGAIAESLRRLTGSEAIRAGAAECRRKMAGQMSDAEMGELVERMAERAMERRKERPRD